MLADYLSLKEFGWLTFEPPTFDEYCGRYLRFLTDHSHIRVFRYEDFVVDSMNVMKEICKHLALDYGDTVVYICEPDDGIYDAMNKGIKASTGDIIYFLNAGDVLIDENVLVDVTAYFNDPKYSKSDFFYGNVLFYKDDYTKVRFLDYQKFPFYRYASNSPCQQVCFYRRNVFDLCGLLDTEFKIYADQEFHARMVVLHNIEGVHIPRTIVRYLEGGFSEKMLSTALSKVEKMRIKKRYFGDTPDWFFERLDSL